MIVSVGIDVVLLERFGKALDRPPLLVERLVTRADIPGIAA